MDYIKKILSLKSNNSKAFEALAIKIFAEQAINNQVYSRYLSLLSIVPSDIRYITDIPFMPISFYKNHVVKTGLWNAEKVFKSSGTSSTTQRSAHFVKSLQWYDTISSKIKDQLSIAEKSTIVALLPSYLEKGDSSLVHMVKQFSKSNPEGREYFYLHDFQKLNDTILEMLNEGNRVTFFAVTFALLDFAKQFQIHNENLEVIFTGGMKNKKKEMFFEDIHKQLKLSFAHSKIISEYGMTELLSQSYSDEMGDYIAGFSKKVIPFEINDPLVQAPFNKTAQLGIVDLANFDTCSFILTEDLGQVKPDGKFKVIGRLSQSDLRGCNLLYLE